MANKYYNVNLFSLWFAMQIYMQRKIKSANHFLWIFSHRNLTRNLYFISVYTCNIFYNIRMQVKFIRNTKTKHRNIFWSMNYVINANTTKKIILIFVENKMLEIRTFELEFIFPIGFFLPFKSKDIIPIET